MPPASSNFLQWGVSLGTKLTGLSFFCSDQTRNTVFHRANTIEYSGSQHKARTEGIRQHAELQPSSYPREGGADGSRYRDASLLVRGLRLVERHRHSLDVVHLANRHEKRCTEDGVGVGLGGGSGGWTDEGELPKYPTYLSMHAHDAKVLC